MLHAAAFCFEAAPPPLQTLIRQSSHSALHLFVGGSISRHPPPTETYGQGTSDYGDWWFRTTIAPVGALSTEEVSAIFATDRCV